MRAQTTVARCLRVAVEAHTHRRTKNNWTKGRGFSENRKKGENETKMIYHDTNYDMMLEEVGRKNTINTINTDQVRFVCLKPRRNSFLFIG